MSVVAAPAPAARAGKPAASLPAGSSLVSASSAAPAVRPVSQRLVPWCAPVEPLLVPLRSHPVLNRPQACLLLLVDHLLPLAAARVPSLCAVPPEPHRAALADSGRVPDGFSPSDPRLCEILAAEAGLLALSAHMQQVGQGSPQGVHPRFLLGFAHFAWDLSGALAWLVSPPVALRRSRVFSRLTTTAARLSAHLSPCGDVA